MTHKKINYKRNYKKLYEKLVKDVILHINEEAKLHQMILELQHDINQLKLTERKENDD